MERDKKINEVRSDLFERYGDAINQAYERAIREALRKHKLAGNPGAISRNGKAVLPDEIRVDWAYAV